MYNKRTIKPAIRQRRIPQLYTLHFYFYTFLSKCNSLYIKDLTYERFRTKDYVRNFNLFMRNEPKFYNPTTIISFCPKRTYNDFYFSDFPQNEPKVKIGKIKPNPLLKKHLYKFPPLLAYKNEPKRTQNKPNSNPVRKDNYGRKTCLPEKSTCKR